MMENMILQGDCLEVLRTLEDESVDCCVTSPPYYGLRNYGTGTWVGGDPKCDHESARLSTRFERTMTDTSSKQTTNMGSNAKSYAKICPVCGAVREDKQIGLEESPEEYVERLVCVFREVKRVLRDDGTLWLNIGDTYKGQKTGNAEICKQKNVLKDKDLIGIPWMLAFALRNDGWYLRQDIIWHKLNPMPESIKDRCTKSHEYIFLLSKNKHYFFNYEAIQEEATGYDGIEPEEYKAVERDRSLYKNLADKGQRPNTMHERRAQGKKDKVYAKRNKRDVWDVPVKPNREAHFATYPEELITPCILAGSKIGGVVLDPFFGSGTTGRVATQYNRKYIGIELNPDYIKIANTRANEVQLSLLGMM